MLESWITIHVLVALLLCGCVLARWQWCVKRCSHLLPADIRDMSRQLSRLIYLGLYLVIGARLMIAISDHVSWRAGDDLQWLLATGLLMLVFVRVLAFRLWLRALEHAAPIG